MVNISKISGLNNLFPKVGQQNQQVSFGSNSTGGNDLQSRLSAIDKGNFFVNGLAPSGAVSGANFKSPSSGSTQQRIEAIGTGELSPKYQEKHLDTFA